MNKFILYTTAIGLTFFAQIGFAQKKLSEQLTLTAMETLWQDSTALKEAKGPKWTYDMGVILEGAAAVWRNTGDGAYFKYIQSSMDAYLDKTGATIKTYKSEDYNIDNVKNGRALLLLYK
mgnify:CR=1 FL=1